MRASPSTPLIGLFTHPCGVWVAPYRMRSGALWFRPIASVARRNLLGGEGT